MDDDEALVRRACAGDASALAALFDRYHTRLFRYALARLGDRFLAEDVAAEVFVEVAQRLPRFRGQAVDFAAWLFTIARHDIADLRRSGWTRRVQPTADLPDRPAPDDPASAAILRLDVARLKAALDRLTDDQRDVVMLRYAAGLGNDETARVLGKPVSAVKSLHHRAIGAPCAGPWTTRRRLHRTTGSRMTAPPNPAGQSRTGSPSSGRQTRMPMW